MKLTISGVLLLLAQQALAADSLIEPDRYRPLHSDRRAWNVGDPLMVIVAESTVAESAAGTGAESNTDIAVQAQDGAGSHGAGVGITGRGDGRGQTTRRGRAFAQISVRIESVVNRQLLRISGVQVLTINGEEQRIRLTGLIRHEDINRDNSIPSHRIADAQIDILGVGDVSDAQRKSIIYKVMKWLGIV